MLCPRKNVGRNVSRVGAPASLPGPLCPVCPSPLPSYTSLCPLSLLFSLSPPWLAQAAVCSLDCHGVLSVPCLRHGLPLALRVKNTRPFETCHLPCLLSHFTSQPSPQPQGQALLLLSLVSWMRSSVSFSGSLPLLSCSPPCFQHPLCTLPSTT